MGGRPPTRDVRILRHCGHLRRCGKQSAFLQAALVPGRGCVGQQSHQSIWLPTFAVFLFRRAAPNDDDQELPVALLPEQKSQINDGNHLASTEARAY